uniref:Uncharacterized protein n=1 Tax=Rhizophora mucronata TaxID=61149 RepID=A0A2P2QRH5_RHIMU
MKWPLEESERELEESSAEKTNLCLRDDFGYVKKFGDTGRQHYG